MSLADDQNALLCNCLAIRQASRHVTQFYDQLLAPSGLRTTQFAILGRLQRSGAPRARAGKSRSSGSTRCLAPNELPPCAISCAR